MPLRQVRHEESDMNEFRGRVAVVTGAASGIGLGLAKRFAAEGMKVVLADIDDGTLQAAVAELKATGAEAAGLRTDVTKIEQIQALCDFAYATYGAVNILCNNAGVSAAGNVWELSEQSWQWVFDVNFWAQVRAQRIFIPKMLAGGEEGHIVNTASSAGLINGNADGGAYSTSKHASVMLSEVLFKELKGIEAKISASVLCPGYVATNIQNSGQHRPAEYGPIEGSPRTPGMPQGSFDTDYIADEVIKAIRADEFYIVPVQQFLRDWIKLRTDRILAGRNPALPGRRANDNRS
jgi:NAD(P)-dependent dehydrogenase (short-subunit alcohol dehydrogenase family)